MRSISETKATMVYFNSDIDDFATVTESYEEVKKLLATVEYMYKEEE